MQRDQHEAREVRVAGGSVRSAYAATIDSVRPVPMTTRSKSEGSMRGASMLLVLEAREKG